MNKVEFLINGKEYFYVKSVSVTHSISKSMGFKSASLSCVTGIVPYKDFLVELNLRKKALFCKLFINDKLYLEGFIDESLVSWKENANGGLSLDINIFERFIGLRVSSLIASRPKGTLQSYLSDALFELGYVNANFINTYQKTIKSPIDFLSVKNQININKPLKAYHKANMVEENAGNAIGECLAINNIVLISNGYDTLSIEKLNTTSEPVFDIYRYNSNLKESNIETIEKCGIISNDDGLTPCIAITLNSYPKKKGETNKKDNNTSVVSVNNNGIPHIIKIHRTNMRASYQELDDMMDYSFAGFKGRSNTFRITLCNIILDDYLNFFQPNKTVNIYDEKTGLDNKMVIMDVNIQLDGTSGSKTTLNVCFKESYEDNVSIKYKGNFKK